MGIQQDAWTRSSEVDKWEDTGALRTMITPVVVVTDKGVRTHSHR